MKKQGKKLKKKSEMEQDQGYDILEDEESQSHVIDEQRRAQDDL